MCVVFDTAAGAISKLSRGEINSDLSQVIACISYKSLFQCSPLSKPSFGEYYRNLRLESIEASTSRCTSQIFVDGGGSICTSGDCTLRINRLPHLESLGSYVCNYKEITKIDQVRTVVGHISSVYKYTVPCSLATD